MNRLPSYLARLARLAPLARLASLASLATLSTCSDPIVPEFDFQTGFLLIEGRITNEPGTSFLNVSRSDLVLETYALIPESGVQAEFVDAESGATFPLIAQGRRLVPADPFAAEDGRSYFARVRTSRGEVFESTPERLPRAVPIVEARIDFEQDAFFSEARNRFVPAFLSRVTFDDPAGEANYYLWEQQTWSEQLVCITCPSQTAYRNGSCVPRQTFRNSQFDYLCDVPCWATSRTQGTNLFTDELTDGNRVRDITVGRDVWDNGGGLLTEIQQYNITQAAYDYNLVLREAAEGGGSLNAPQPATLVGNVSALEGTETLSLGFVGVAAVSTERIYFDRDTVDGVPLPFETTITLEPTTPTFTPPRAPCEGNARTRIRPRGWPE